MDFKIHIKYADTNNQFADMFTKGNFTCDEWNHLLLLFNIMKFSMFSCSQFLSSTKSNAMSRRAQQRRTGEELVVAKSRPVSLISRSLSANQSAMLDSGTLHSSGWIFDLTSTEKSGRDSTENSASSSQVWHRGDYPLSINGKSVREMNQRSSTRKSGPDLQNQLTEVKLNHHNLEISNTRYVEKVFADVRQKLNRQEDDQTVVDQKVNVLIWRFFML